MKIKEITISGMHKLKNATTYTFNDNVTYFIGDNGAGKSTILEATQLGLLGYIPGYAKTNEAIMKHASSDSLSVSLVLDDDIKINRRWVRFGTSVKSEVSVENYQKENLPDLISDIELPVFNFSEFKNLTANKLKEWFITFLPNLSDDLDIEQELRKAMQERSLPIDHLVDDMMVKVNASDLKGIDLVKQVDNWIKEGQTYIKGQVAKLQATIGSLIHYDDDDIVGDEDEIMKEISELTSLADQLARYESAKHLYDRAVESVNELKDSLPADCFANDSRVKDMEAKVESLDKESSELQDTLMGMQNEKFELLKKRGELNAEVSKLSAIKGDVCPFTNAHCATVAGMIEENSKKASELTKEIQNLDNMIKEIDAKAAKVGSVSSKQSEKQQILSNIEFIRSQYSKLDALECQLIDPGTAPTSKSYEEIKARIEELNGLLAKVIANKKFDALSEQITKDKFDRENDLEVLKVWDKAFGANGLQTQLMDKPFKDLADEMSKYLTKMFGEPVTAQFNLVSKANSFSFGIVSNGSYIEFDYLSSGERCLFTLALTMCILNKSKSPVRVLLIDDILDHLDEANASYLFDTVKNIDDIQFIMAGVKECKDTTLCKAV